MSDCSKATVAAAATVVVLASALVIPLIWVAFYAETYTDFQKVVVVLVSLILAGLIISVMWILWASRRGIMRPWDWKGRKPSDS